MKNQTPKESSNSHSGSRFSSQKNPFFSKTENDTFFSDFSNDNQPFFNSIQLKPLGDPPPQQLKNQLEREFEIYSTSRLKKLGDEIIVLSGSQKTKEEKQNEKRKFEKLSDRFRKKMKGKKESLWGTEKYYKLRDKYFPLYESEVTKMEDAAKAQIETSISLRNEKLQAVLTLHKQALEKGNANITEVKIGLDKVSAELITVEEEKQGANDIFKNVSKPYTKEVTEPILTGYDLIIEKYKVLLSAINSNIDELTNDKNNLELLAKETEYFESLVNKFQEKVNKAEYIGDFNDLIANDLPELTNEFDNIIARVGNFKEVGERIDLEHVDEELGNLSKERNDLKERVPSQETDPAKLNDKQIKELAAVVLAEGAQGDETSHVMIWVYINNIKIHGYDKAMRKSAAYHKNGAGDRGPLNPNINFKRWMLAQGAGQEFSEEEITPGNVGKAQFVYNYIKNEVIADLGSNPLGGMTSQGYSGDLNTDGEKGDHWPQARQYLILWLKGEVDGKYMEIIGEGKNITYLFNDIAITNYFNLPANIHKIPEKDNYASIPDVVYSVNDQREFKLDDNGNKVLEIDGMEISPTYPQKSIL